MFGDEQHFLAKYGIWSRYSNNIVMPDHLSMLKQNFNPNLIGPFY